MIANNWKGIITVERRVTTLPSFDVKLNAAATEMNNVEIQYCLGITDCRDIEECSLEMMRIMNYNNDALVKELQRILSTIE